ncbi:hypothetical protein CPB85DRAFT_248345 [Mucidula mucida]|nr:hypothetical protein CPB85DRAFT_248345 [Mucidula mucida]
MSQPGAATLKLEDQRLHWKESSAGNTVQVPVETFLAHYTNLLHSQRDTDDLVSHIEEGLKAKPKTSNGETKPRTLNKDGWAATNFIGPHEDTVFKGLEGIAEEIHSHCETWNKTKQHPKLQQRTTRLICQPNHTTASEVRGGSMKTDARFILNEIVSDENVPTSAAVAPAEFKTRMNPKNQIDNESKIIGAVGHILYNDPCRRSVIAFTIEDRPMRFWYFSRSHIAVSAQFDYHANPRLFIRFVIFMTFASLEDLGYDPTVERVRVGDSKKIQYRFTIGDKVYQTTGIIYELNLDLVTRATRVWSVVELDSNYLAIGTPKVLKDVWLYFDATPESDIYNAIFAALRQLDEDGSVPENERPPPLQSGSSLEQDAKHYFMTIVSDSVVMINGQPDEAQEPPAGYLEFFYTEEEDKFAMEAALEGTQRGDVDGNTPTLKRADGEAYPHKKRTHRRIVFAELCHTLYRVSTYAAFTKGLAQLVYGLEYMRLAGFVHRDISPGNCLIFEGQTKISDLEYTRQYAGPVHGAAPLTGTPGFMAVEYQMQKHEFRPKAVRHILRGVSRLPQPAPWFRFNFLHDLESVIWIYLWFLLETLPESFTPSEIDEHRIPILILRHRLFDGSLKASTERMNFILNCATPVWCGYNDVTSVLTAVFGADSKIIKALQSFECLAGCYEDVELSKPLLTESPHTRHWDRKVFLHEYYQYIHLYFMNAHDHITDTTEKALPIRYTDQERQHRAQQAAGASKTGSNKRPRTGTGRDSEAYVPPVREDEDDDDEEEEGEERAASPTEESQDRKTKRKRAVRKK